MIKHAVQVISRAVRLQNPGVDESDLPWKTIPGHDYDNPAEAWAAADEFDQAFDGEYIHRVVKVEVHVEPVVKPKPPKPAKPKPAPMNRQMSEHRAQAAYERNRDMLLNGLSLGWPRVHLDPLVELCRIHLSMAGSSVLTRRYAAQLDKLAAEVAGRGNLRAVQ